LMLWDELDVCVAAGRVPQAFVPKAGNAPVTAKATVKARKKRPLENLEEKLLGKSPFFERFGDHCRTSTSFSTKENRSWVTEGPGVKLERRASSSVRQGTRAAFDLLPS